MCLCLPASRKQGQTQSTQVLCCVFGGLLQRGRDHSPPKACFYLRSPALDWLSHAQYYKYTVAKQNGGGAEWVELFIALTRRVGKPMYGW